MLLRINDENSNSMFGVEGDESQDGDAENTEDGFKFSMVPTDTITSTPVVEKPSTSKKVGTIMCQAMDMYYIIMKSWHHIYLIISVKWDYFPIVLISNISPSYLQVDFKTRANIQSGQNHKFLCLTSARLGLSIILHKKKMKEVFSHRKEISESHFERHYILYDDFVFLK